MSIIAFFVIASFTLPEKIGTEPKSLLWLLPLAAAITVVYKATKLPKITAGNFIKESALLLGSMVVFIIAIALGLYVLAWLIIE